MNWSIKSKLHYRYVDSVNMWQTEDSGMHFASRGQSSRILRIFLTILWFSGLSKCCIIFTKKPNHSIFQCPNCTYSCKTQTSFEKHGLLHAEPSQVAIPVAGDASTKNLPGTLGGTSTTPSQGRKSVSFKRGNQCFFVPLKNVRYKVFKKEGEKMRVLSRAQAKVAWAAFRLLRPFFFSPSSPRFSPSPSQLNFFGVKLKKDCLQKSTNNLTQYYFLHPS